MDLRCCSVFLCGISVNVTCPRSGPYLAEGRGQSPPPPRLDKVTIMLLEVSSLSPSPSNKRKYVSTAPYSKMARYGAEDRRCYGTSDGLTNFVWEIIISQTISHWNKGIKHLCSLYLSHVCLFVFVEFGSFSRGGGYLGQVLLGMCRWPLRTPTPL